MDRNQKIIKTSFLGIGVNVLLSILKLVVGTISGSIAITLDAVNNLSDALSSVITIIGTKIAGKEPDKKHPFGYGRVEYISASIIAVLVLYAGVTSLIESVKAIIHPEAPSYTAPLLIIVAAAVLIKFVLGRYFVRVGRSVDSGSLIASGKEANLDALVSLSTLAAALIYLKWNVSLEAWLGAIISILMIRTGVEMLRETVSRLLGERPAIEKAGQLRRVIGSFPDVSGVYDLVIHNYGPDSLIGSVHIEVPDYMRADALDGLMREIVEKVAVECGVRLTGISVYGRNTNHNEAEEIEQTIRGKLLSTPHVIQMHGFYLNEEKKQIQFDVVVDFDTSNRRQIFDDAIAGIRAMYPDYTIQAILDPDTSD